jgi:hypothetical protein
MRRFLLCAVVLGLVGGTAFAAGPMYRDAPVRAPQLNAHALPWVEFAAKGAVRGDSVKLEVGTKQRPAVRLETEYYVYPYTDPDTAQQVTTPSLMLSMDGSGYAKPVTLWLYWQNRRTGERRYLANGQILAAGEVKDIFGTDGTALWAPTLDRFMFLGSNGAWGAGPANPTGLYMFGLDVRDASGETVLSRGYALYSHVDEIVIVDDDVTGDTVWTANNAYLLAKGGADFPVYVGAFNGNGASATLTIEPGTVVFGDKQQLGTLSVQRGSKLIAAGTPLMPIIMTSAFKVGDRVSGDWGGLVINGYAPVGSETGERSGEGETGLFGGDDPNDSSGVLSYVRVEFAGVRFTEEDELNGIALQGVGAGTSINNIQVNRNADDGVEFFGGTVNVTNLLLTGIEDDSIDWTFGWNGFVSNAVIWQGLAVADHGIEADNDEDVPDREPRSFPKIFNATFVGNQALEGGEGRAARLRRGTAALIRNAIFVGFPAAGIRVTEDETWVQAQQGNLAITNSIIFGNGNVGQGGGNITNEQVVDWLEDEAARNQFVDPMLGDAFNTVAPDLLPLPGSPALNATYGAPTSDYIGGVAPGGDPWIYQPWTSYAFD